MVEVSFKLPELLIALTLVCMGILDLDPTTPIETGTVTLGAAETESVATVGMVVRAIGNLVTHLLD